MQADGERTEKELKHHRDYSRKLEAKLVDLVQNGNNKGDHNGSILEILDKHKSELESAKI